MFLYLQIPRQWNSAHFQCFFSIYTQKLCITFTHSFLHISFKRQTMSFLELIWSNKVLRISQSIQDFTVNTRFPCDLCDGRHSQQCQEDLTIERNVAKLMWRMKHQPSKLISLTFQSNKPYICSGKNLGKAYKLIINSKRTVINLT